METIVALIEGAVPLSSSHRPGSLLGKTLTQRSPCGSALKRSMERRSDTDTISASQDNVRLWNTADYFYETAEESMRRQKSRLPGFKIIAGHHGGTVSSMRMCFVCIVGLSTMDSCMGFEMLSGASGCEGIAQRKAWFSIRGAGSEGIRTERERTRTDSAWCPYRVKRYE